MIVHLITDGIACKRQGRYGLNRLVHYDDHSNYAILLCSFLVPQKKIVHLDQ